MPDVVTNAAFKHQRPSALVVACSDGRLQESLDQFLGESLRITAYDRLYMPGGPGALARSGLELLRPDQFRKELEFLVTAHQVEDVVLIFHGPSADGPAEASCGDYKRRFSGRSPAELRTQQEQDAREIARAMFGPGKRTRLRMFRCEVTRELGIQFVELAPR